MNEICTRGKNPCVDLERSSGCVVSVLCVIRTAFKAPSSIKATMVLLQGETGCFEEA